MLIIYLFDKDNTIITTESNHVKYIQYNYEYHCFLLAFTNDMEYWCSYVFGYYLLVIYSAIFMYLRTFTPFVYLFWLLFLPSLSESVSKAQFKTTRIIS